MLKSLILGLSALTLSSQTATAETLFEAFYRMERKGKHVGYLIVRSSKDSQGTRTISSYARRLDDDGGLGDESFESLKAIAKAETAQPISSESIRVRKGERLAITASFDAKGVGRVNFLSSPKGKTSTRTETTTPANLLSAMAADVTDWSKLKEGYTYTYNTFNENSGRNGAEALTYVGKKKIGGITVLHALYHFNGQLVETFHAESGEILASRSWNGELISYWVNNRDEAFGQFEFPSAEVTRVFSDLPTGKKNPWATRPLNGISILNAFPKARNPDPKKAGLTLPRRSL